MEHIKILKDKLNLSSKDGIILRDGLSLDRILTPREKEISTKSESLIKGVLYEVNDDGYGNEVLKRVNSNTVVFSGAVLALEHLANVTATFKPATLNEIYSVNSAVPGSNINSFINLFGIGTGGAALDFGNVITPVVKQREVLNFIPLRTGATIVGTADLAKYFFKKPAPSGTEYNWYLKEFDSATVIKSLWKDAAEQDADGTEITAEIYNSARTEGIESFAEFRIKFNSYDVREYFEYIGEMDMARYNSIGLFTGQKVDIGGAMDYVNVRLFSVVNFENSSVKEKKESTYVYRVYSLV